MNSGYFRQDNESHWYHIPEQHVELFDWALENENTLKEITNEQLTGYKDGRVVQMTGQDIIEWFFDNHQVGYPGHYKTILFDE